MATCTPQSIASLLNCLTQLAPRQSTAAWARLVCGAPTPPPTDQGITTDPGPNAPVITTDSGLIITPDP